MRSRPRPFRVPARGASLSGYGENQRVSPGHVEVKSTITTNQAFRPAERSTHVGLGAANVQALFTDARFVCEPQVVAKSPGGSPPALHGRFAYFWVFWAHRKIRVYEEVRKTRPRNIDRKPHLGRHRRAPRGRVD